MAKAEGACMISVLFWRGPHYRDRMSIQGYLRSRIPAFKAWRAHRKTMAEGGAPVSLATLDDWERSLRDPTGYYLDCHRYFHQSISPEIRRHRQYFQQTRRGFGEDAFHVMWWLLFRKFPLREFLEIGVYRGQVLSLAAFLQQQTGATGTVAGISPFEPIGDSVSKYQGGIDYEADTKANCAHFGGTTPKLLRAYSTASEAQRLIASQAWDCVYIDGNHDLEVAQADWNLCAEHLTPKGIIVMDDAGLTTAYTPPPFATKGHPGPSQVAAEIDRAAFWEILQVGHNRVFQKQ